MKLFCQNACLIFGVVGSVYGLTFYLAIPKGSNDIILFGIAGILCLFLFTGRLIQRLYEKAYTDCLTGLKSRAEFGPVINKRSKHSNKMASLLMIDVDNFKMINDRYGHCVGDDTLKALASIFHQSVREADSVFRWGGDEFVIILPGTSVEDAAVFAERIRFTVETTGLYFLTVSIGVADIINGNVGEAFVVADKAMYEAKKQKNSIAVSYTRQESVILQTA